MTVYAGDPVLASDINDALNRRVGTFEGITDLTATSGTTEKLCDSVTATLKAGRRYTIRAFFPGNASVAADRFLLRIRVGNATSGLQLTYGRTGAVTTGNNDQLTIQTDYVPAADGSFTCCTTVQRDSGTGTWTPKGAGTQPRYLTIDLATTA